MALRNGLYREKRRDGTLGCRREVKATVRAPQLKTSHDTLEALFQVIRHRLRPARPASAWPCSTETKNLGPARRPPAGRIPSGPEMGDSFCHWIFTTDRHTLPAATGRLLGAGDSCMRDKSLALPWPVPPTEAATLCAPGSSPFFSMATKAGPLTRLGKAITVRQRRASAVGQSRRFRDVRDMSGLQVISEILVCR